jgi:WD40 repeat protein
LAWSFYNASILAALSISKEISFFEFDKSTIKLQRSIKCENIPVYGAFYPSFRECIFSVGFSDGAIALYNDCLEEVFMVHEHKQSVNWLSWERRLGISERNRWILEYFTSYVDEYYLSNVPPMLASCSSDCHINFYSIQNQKLEHVHSFKAH